MEFNCRTLKLKLWKTKVMFGRLLLHMSKQGQSKDRDK